MPENINSEKLDPRESSVDLPEQEKSEVNLTSEQEAEKREIVRLLKLRSIDMALRMKDKLKLSEESFSEVVKIAIIELFQERDINGFHFTFEKLKKVKLIPEDFLQSAEVIKAIKEMKIHCLSDGDENEISLDRENFNLPEEFFKSPEVLEAAKKGMIQCLSKGKTESGRKFKKKYGFKISIQEVIDEFPDIDKMISSVEELVPNFREQVLKSEELLFGLFNFKNNPEYFLAVIKDNPFLTKAIENNPNFATKLIIKYPEFDELSQEGIKLLFDTKEQILTENSDIDPNSLEFRRLTQEKLKGYKNNSEILKTLERKGVNIEEWLNYSEVSHFQLGEGEDVPFSEVIATPINRIKETVDAYIKTIKEKLKEYKPELSEFKIPLEDSKDIDEGIGKMQVELEKAQTEGNDKKAKGIERGIEGLNKRKEKTVSVWNKINGDISSFERMGEEVFRVNEELKKGEELLKEELAKERPLAKDVKKLKKQISELKEELKSKFATFEKRIDYFQIMFSAWLEPALGQFGKERAETIVQEIQMSLEEQFDHYHTDRSTLDNLFSESGSEKEKNKLENQPMNILVWSRNPDIDLYQGNYSPCCIRIDSDHMGAESTIADYSTDLGVQIVNIWDESESKPVTAAWCWLSKNKNGEVVLVVDNIESNTLYSTSYPDQLTKELFSYLENYAKKIGAKKVVLGKANNDLPTSAKLGELEKDKERYEKLGGYNREDGYFLEAEKEVVKIVWEAEGGWLTDMINEAKVNTKKGSI